MDPLRQGYFRQMLLRALLLLILIRVPGAQGQTDRYDVVINEIMADPSPVVGLPNTEYIELRNNSAKKIDLLKWRIIKGNTMAVISSSWILEPDSVVVICSRSQALLFNLPSKALGITSFPALVNEGDLIALAGPDGKTIHAMEYNTTWYRNPIKELGGWSLEMINPLLPCGANNWAASTDPSGGTPGRENSVYNKKSGREQLLAIQCLAVGDTKLQLQLNQGADSLSLSTATNYTITSPLQVPRSAKVLAPLFNAVELILDQPIEKNKLYILRGSSLADCKSTSTDIVSARTGLPELPDSSNLVINELLFDPPAGGSDFIELYNKGPAVLDARAIWLTSFGTAGQGTAAYRASEKSFNFFPGEHLVLTTDTAFVAKAWKAEKEKLLEMKSMPSLPDEDGNLVLMNSSGKIIDRLDYRSSMHFPLIRNKEGISLERVDVHSPSAATDNWHSASANSGYATPTQMNSQTKQNSSSTKTIRISPELISPNNDGTADLLTVDYAFHERGTLMTVYLFSEKGVLLDKIIDNRLCGTKGSFFWNGMDSKGKRIGSGVYILAASTFHLNGERSLVKKVIGITY